MTQHQTTTPNPCVNQPIYSPFGNTPSIGQQFAEGYQQGYNDMNDLVNRQLRVNPNPTIPSQTDRDGARKQVLIGALSELHVKMNNVCGLLVNWIDKNVANAFTTNPEIKVAGRDEQRIVGISVHVSVSKIQINDKMEMSAYSAYDLLKNCADLQNAYDKLFQNVFADATQFGPFASSLYSPLPPKHVGSFLLISNIKSGAFGVALSGMPALSICIRDGASVDIRNDLIAQVRNSFRDFELEKEYNLNGPSCTVCVKMDGDNLVMDSCMSITLVKTNYVRLDNVLNELNKQLYKDKDV